MVASRQRLGTGRAAGVFRPGGSLKHRHAILKNGHREGRSVWHPGLLSYVLDDLLSMTEENREESAELMRPAVREELD